MRDVLWGFGLVTRIFSVLMVATMALCTIAPGQVAPNEDNALSGAVPLQVIVLRTAEEAEKVLKELQAGEDFARLARKVSIDPTADDGGFMGNFAPSELRAELRDALQGLGAGQLTPVVHIPSGYAILRIVPGNKTKAGAVARNSLDMSATGSVQYLINIGGLAEAEAVISRYPSPPGWNADPEKVCEIRNASLDAIIDKFKDMLASPITDGQPRSPMDQMQVQFALAQIYAYLGQMDLAIERYNAAYQTALAGVHDALPQMEETLGIVYLHKSEMENDVFESPGSRCIFPMGPEDAFPHKADSDKAIAYFLKFLKHTPDNLEVKWLLNIAYMTVGSYPAGVPRQFLIPPSSFRSKEDVGKFVDVAFEAGLKSFSMAGGVIVDDFENNGRLDVVTSGFGSCSHMHYFHNNGDGTFTDETEQAGLTDQVGGLNMMQTDYNNDGCLDILVLRGGWEFPQRKSLLRNNCNGTFTDVTVASGLGEPTSTQTAVWVDINNDGWLDLFVGNETGPAQLFLNKGDGTFADIAESAGVAGDGTAYIKGVAAADYDNDGYPDLYVSNTTGRNFLYHNNHDNTFTEVALKAGVPGSGKGFATWFFDYDNDGWPDIFATSYFGSVDEVARTYIGLPHNATTLKLYRNMHDGTFQDVTAKTGLDKVYMPMGANFGDIDNDGYLDIYLATGTPSYGSLMPNVLLRNHDGKYFVDVTTSSGTGELHRGHGVAFADLTNTGNEDIIAETGGATIGDSHALRVFENPGHHNDWITLKLVGVKTNRAAIGARISVTVKNREGHVRSIYRTVGSGGSFGASPLQQHIGLGEEASIQSVDIYWPASNTHQHFTDVEKNEFLEIKEFESRYTKLERKPVRLGGKPLAKLNLTTSFEENFTLPN